MFIDFASFGSRQTFADMDGAKFFKLCKDTRLVTRAFTVIDVDIIFAKARDFAVSCLASTAKGPYQADDCKMQVILT